MACLDNTFEDKCLKPPICRTVSFRPASLIEFDNISPVSDEAQPEAPSNTRARDSASFSSAQRGAFVGLMFLAQTLTSGQSNAGCI